MGVLPLAQLPPTRREYDTLLRAKGFDQYQAGYLPYSIVDGWQQIAKDFAYWRAAVKGAETAATPEERAWFEADRRLREKLTLRDIGIWSHYDGDASQPMHVSVHISGWGKLRQSRGLQREELPLLFRGRVREGQHRARPGGGRSRAVAALQLLDRGGARGRCCSPPSPRSGRSMPWRRTAAQARRPARHRLRHGAARRRRHRRARHDRRGLAAERRHAGRLSHGQPARHRERQGQGDARSVRQGSRPIVDIDSPAVKTPRNADVRGDN